MVGSWNPIAMSNRLTNYTPNMTKARVFVSSTCGYWEVPHMDRISHEF